MDNYSNEKSIDHLSKNDVDRPVDDADMGQHTPEAYNITNAPREQPFNDLQKDVDGLESQTDTLTDLGVDDQVPEAAGGDVDDPMQSNEQLSSDYGQQTYFDPTQGNEQPSSAYGQQTYFDPTQGNEQPSSAYGQQAYFDPTQGNERPTYFGQAPQMNSQQVYNQTPAYGRPTIQNQPHMTYQQEQYGAPNYGNVVRKTSPCAVIGFILAIISIVISVLGLFDPWYALIYTAGAGLFAIAGLILSIVGRKKAKSNPQRVKGGGLAIAGLVISILSFLSVIMQLICYAQFFDFLNMW
ncbi:MAG TPA: hypothetical protein GX717_06290 [Clostridiaceae bacterium]|nr:hypothetical protein [Clostridiaceae bacterium]